MKTDGISSYVNNDIILGNAMTVFKDINPEITENDSYFHTHIARMEGENPIVDIGTMRMQDIAESVEAMIHSKTVRSIAGKKNALEPTLIEINHLSLPRGMIRHCEVCQKNAYFCCQNCLVTFYCSVTHRRKDKICFEHLRSSESDESKYVRNRSICFEHLRSSESDESKYVRNRSVHAHICNRLRVVRHPAVHKFTNVDRRRIIGQKIYVTEKLLNDLIRQSYGYLQEKYEDAIITLCHGQKMLPKVYGRGRFYRQLTIILTSLCEAKIGLNELEDAEVALRKAMATLWSAEDTYGRKAVNFSIAQVKGAQGKLLYALGDFEEATFFFSENIYHVTKALGPYHVRATAGYFNLAKTFMKRELRENGYSVLQFCASLWVNFLYGILESIVTRASVSDLSASLGQSEDEAEHNISFITEMELRSNMHEAWTFADEESQPKLACQINLCEAILLFVYRIYKEAKDFVSRALRLALTLVDKDLLAKIKYVQKHVLRRDAADHK